MFPELTEEEVDYVIGKVLEWDQAASDGMTRPVQSRRRGHGQARHAPCRRLPGQRPLSKWPASATSTPRRLDAAARQAGRPAKGTDAAAWSRRVKPDVFCFCTLPNLRTDMIRIGIESGARLIALEKPVALTSAEGFEIREAADGERREGRGQPSASLRRALPQGEGDRGQRRAGPHPHGLRHRHRLDDAHALAPDRLHALVQRRGRGAVGHGAGGRPRQAGRHRILRPITSPASSSSPTACAASSNAAPARPDVPEVDYWWRKCRIGAQGTDGFAEVLTGGGWRAVTKSGASSGRGLHELRSRHAALHSGNGRLAGRRQQSPLPAISTAPSKGFEIMMALCRSVAEGGQVALPLTEAPTKSRC